MSKISQCHKDIASRLVSEDLAPHKAKAIKLGHYDRYDKSQENVTIILTACLERATPQDLMQLLANKLKMKDKMLALVVIKPQTGGDEDAFIITDKDNFAHAVILPQTTIITYGIEK